METMDDNDIGDYLKIALHHRKDVPSQQLITTLISKLVAERAQNHFWAIGRGKNPSDFIDMALDDYGISQAEWEKLNG